MLLKSQLQWLEHGGQQKRYRDSLKACLKACALDPHKIEELAQDRSTWTATCGKAIEKFEAGRIQTLERKREVGKQHTVQAPTVRLLLSLLLRPVVPRDAPSVVRHGFNSTHTRDVIDEIRCLRRLRPSSVQY